MAFCPKCGKEAAADAKFCTSCGAQLAAEEAKNTGAAMETPAGAQGQPQKEANAQSDPLGEQIADKAQELMNTPDSTAEFDKADIEANRVFAILAYLGILVLIPLLAAPNSRFARYHTNQGLILWIASILISAVGVIPILGWIVAVVGNVVTFILMIIGIINAAGGRAKQLPIIGGFTLLK